jgi:hypothetical protein
MFCPKCGAEYREGFYRCVDCEVDLVDEAPDLPSAAEATEHYVTVMRAGDPALLLMAKSLLQDAGIAFSAKDEGLQDLFAAGRLGTGFNPLVGPAEIQVSSSDEEVAREVLRDLERGTTMEEETADEEDGDADLEAFEEESAVESADAEDSSSRRDKNVFRALVVGQVLATLLGYLTYDRFVAGLPDEVLDAIDKAVSTLPEDTTFSGFYSVLMPLSLAAAAGVFAFWSPARYVFVLVQGAYLLSSALAPAGVGVTHGLSGFFGGLESLLSGAIIALAFWSPVSGSFEKRGPEREPEPDSTE